MTVALLVLLALTYRAFASSIQSDADRRTGAGAALTAQAIAQALQADVLLAAGVAGADGVADLVRGTASQPAISAVEYAALNVERANPSVQGLYFYDRRGAYVVGEVVNPGGRPPVRLGVTCDPTGVFCTDTNAPVAGYLTSPALRAAMASLIRSGTAPAPVLAFDRSTGPYGSLFIVQPIAGAAHGSAVGCLLEQVDAAGILRPYVTAPGAPSLILSGAVVLGPDASHFWSRGQVPVSRPASGDSRVAGLVQAPVPFSLAGPHPRFRLGGAAMTASIAAVPGADLRVVGYAPAPRFPDAALLLLLALGLAFLLALASLLMPFVSGTGAWLAAIRHATPDGAVPLDASSAAAMELVDASARESAALGGGASAWSVQRALAAEAAQAPSASDGPDAQDGGALSAAPGEAERDVLERPPRMPGLIPTLLRRRRALPVAPSAMPLLQDAAPTLSGDARNRPVDVALRLLIERFSADFPARVRACYVYGSYADGSDVGGSDVDLSIVFAGSWRNRAEQDAAQALLARCVEASRIELDGDVLAEVELKGGALPDLKFGSRLIYGTDFRDDLALVPIDEWTRNRMHAAYFLIATRFNRPGAVALPLDYPDPAGPFYGYDSRPIRLPDDTEAPSTRDLIRVAGWSATALVALRAGEYVIRKRDSHRLYRRHIGDAWSDLLDDLYTVCRDEWQYRIPEREDDRRRLRTLCEGMHGFENHMLGSYRDYLLGELAVATGAYAERLIALLDRAPFHDSAVETALSALRVRGAADSAASSA